MSPVGGRAQQAADAVERRVRDDVARSVAEPDVAQVALLGARRNRDLLPGGSTVRGPQHGAVVAREYGLPGVVNVAGCTELIEDGERLEIDGARGAVVRLDRPQERSGTDRPGSAGAVSARTAEA